MKMFRYILCTLSLIYSTTFVRAQSRAIALTSKTKRAIVDSLGHTLVLNYIYLDTAKKMESFLQKQLGSGKYETISNPNNFAQQLTSDLRSVYSDKHLAIRFDPTLQAGLADTGTANAAHDQERRMKIAGEKNFGFQKVEILNGNMGYLKLNQFYEVNEESMETVRNALFFLQHVEGLIIDLRTNGGGDAAMVNYICSYFLPFHTHINDLYTRRTHSTETFITDSVRRPKAFARIPIYILVSGRTFSGAEEFSYDMQQQHRAVIVGEITGGAAHPVEPISISNGFIGNIPYARAINPVTAKNWEAVGVKPDIITRADSAQDIAMLNFYDYEIAHASDSGKIFSAHWARDIIYARLYPISPDPSVLKTFTGNYAGRTIHLENGVLFIRGQDGKNQKLIALSPHTFKTEADYMQLDFAPDGLNIRYDDGFVVHYDKGAN